MSVSLGLGIEPNLKNVTVTKRPVICSSQNKRPYACRTQPSRISSRCRNGYIPSKRCRFRIERDLAPALCKLCLSGRSTPPRLSPSSLERRDDKDGGDRRDRTDDLMLAKQPLSQLSYVPKRWVPKHKGKRGDASQGRPAARAHARNSLRRRTSPPAPEASPTMVGLGRLERPTSPLSGVRSNHLSYRPEPVLC